FLFFFFQAEDGIRDLTVTGVQTCALPISFGIKPLYYADDGLTVRFASQVKALLKGGAIDAAPEPAGSVGFLIWGSVPEPFTLYRSEERRVGKECRCRWRAEE